jgi:hypothetical protein
MMILWKEVSYDPVGSVVAYATTYSLRRHAELLRRHADLLRHYACLIAALCRHILLRHRAVAAALCRLHCGIMPTVATSCRQCRHILLRHRAVAAASC